MNINQRLTTALESNPGLGWWGTFISWLTAALAWMLDHAPVLTTVFGVFAAIFGAVAGYYTMRIQRRTFIRGEQSQHPNDTQPPTRG